MAAVDTAAAEVRIAVAAECLAAAARHAAVASAAVAGLTAVDDPQVQASLNAAVNRRDAQARWDVQAAALADRAARRRLMAARMESAEAVPAIRAPRAAQATVLPMGSGIPSAAELVAAQDPRAAAVLPPDAVARPMAIFTPSVVQRAARAA